MLRFSVASALAGLVVRGARVKRTEQQTIAGVEVRDFRAGVEDWIIMFADGTSKDEMRAMCGTDCKILGNPDQGGVAWASVKGTTVVEKMLSTRRSAAGVAYLVQDRVDYAIPIIEDETVTTDSRASLWGLTAVGASNPLNSGSGVHIFVQDTGIRTTHSEFGNRAVPEFDVTTGLVTPCYGSGGCAVDRQGHGTHCAGTAGGKSYGVAPGAKIYAVKTLGDDGSGQRSWQYSGIEHVASSSKRPAVLSMSLGGPDKDPVYDREFDAAIKKGVVVVVAAGNDNSNACNFSPAFAEKAITVGATDSTNTRAWYSNWGKCVNIMAPGTEIKSAWKDDNTATNTISGTSMACPHVSGGAALLLSKNPGSSPLTIRSQLMSRARTGFVADLKWDDPDTFLWVGKGAAPPSAPTPAPPPTPPPPKCPFFAKEEEPDVHGDCGCRDGYFCSLNGWSRNCPTSQGTGGWGGYYFLPTCTTCRCYFEPY